MEKTGSVCHQSEFMLQNLPLLLSRFKLSCDIDANCVEYHLSKIADNQEISFSLIFSLDTFAKYIYVAKFYPELFRQENSHYLSAAVFYLLIHHFAQHYHLTSDYRIFLRTTFTVFQQFYCLLKDFHFQIMRAGVGDRVEVESPFTPVRIDTTMISENTLTAIL